LQPALDLQNHIDRKAEGLHWIFRTTSTGRQRYCTGSSEPHRQEGRGTALDLQNHIDRKAEGLVKHHYNVQPHVVILGDLKGIDNTVNTVTTL